MVQRDGYQVPLIGIPKAAVLETCECCHNEFPISLVMLHGGQMLCTKCRFDSMNVRHDSPPDV